MQKDFHYYCIAVLARAAGFYPSDALTIAYASQYVDDATESVPITVGKQIFEPVRTAHYGLEAFTWPVQKKVYMPFHFLPTSADNYVTSANSSFSRALLSEAYKEKSSYLLRLCRIGVALHTYADTWSHEGFTGTISKKNRVNDLCRFVNGNEEYLEIGYEALPKIGHLQAEHIPDYPYLKWQYKNYKNKNIEHDNTSDFLKAAEIIYKQLSKAPKRGSANPIPWEEIYHPIRNLLAMTGNKKSRCNNWKKEFKALFAPQDYEYDKLSWRKDALGPKRPEYVKWDDPDEEYKIDYKFEMKKGFHKKPWVQFHKAASMQRNFVIQKILMSPA